MKRGNHGASHLTTAEHLLLTVVREVLIFECLDYATKSMDPEKDGGSKALEMRSSEFSVLLSSPKIGRWFRET
jgi:hypothetical protein